jgi:hypothetical protein
VSVRPGGQVDGDLLVAQRRLQHTCHAGQQPIHHPLLLTLHVPHVGQLLLHSGSEQLRANWAEHDRLGLDAFIVMIRQRVVRVDRLGSTGSTLSSRNYGFCVLQRDALVLERIEHARSL